MSYLEKIHAPDQTVNPLFHLLGIRAEHIDSNKAVLQLPYKHTLLQGAGIVSGGVLATLLDEAMAHVALAAIAPKTSIATVDIHVQFLAAARPETDLTATARVAKAGSRIIFTQAEVIGNGRTLARATASFAINGQ